MTTRVPLSAWKKEVHIVVIYVSHALERGHANYKTLTGNTMFLPGKDKVETCLVTFCMSFYCFML